MGTGAQGVRPDQMIPAALTANTIPRMIRRTPEVRTLVLHSFSDHLGWRTYGNARKMIPMRAYATAMLYL